jgi:hypothetical protein
MSAAMSSTFSTRRFGSPPNGEVAARLFARFVKRNGDILGLRNWNALVEIRRLPVMIEVCTLIA